MNQYISDTEFAAKLLITAIFEEEHKLIELDRKLSELLPIYNVLLVDIFSEDNPDDFDDIDVREKHILFQTYNRVHKLPDLKKEIEKIKDSIVNKSISIDSLSMSLLQIFKQGISQTHGHPSNCPPGRNIGSQNLKTIVWEGRNQAIHCEEGSPSARVIACFHILKMDFGVEFDLETDLFKNRAKAILNLLDWSSYEKYSSDLESLIN